jgi:tRNA pseudouridine38-40 synthase
MPATLKLTIAYDGTGFRGSQRQKNGRSVQEELENALSTLYGQETRVALAGRTDAGVHAVGQVASVTDERPTMSDERMARAINAHMDDDLAVVHVGRRDATFHARYDATWREYRYRVWWGAPQPLQRLRAWQRGSALDLAAMAAGAAHLNGPTDLASFAGSGMGVGKAGAATGRGTVRTIRHCSVLPVDEWWGSASDVGSGAELRIVADGFLPQAVRTIMSALVEIGRGTRTPEWLEHLIDAGDRRMGPKTAPPHGLILWRVGYGDDVPDPDPSGEQTRDEPVHSRLHG